jgi:hypothetical protein
MDSIVEYLQCFVVDEPMFGAVDSVVDNFVVVAAMLLEVDCENCQVLKNTMDLQQLNGKLLAN